jgi:hypothetical protein
MPKVGYFNNVSLSGSACWKTDSLALMVQGRQMIMLDSACGSSSRIFVQSQPGGEPDAKVSHYLLFFP